MKQLNVFFIIWLLLFSLFQAQAAAPIKFNEIDSDVELRGAIFVDVDATGFYGHFDDGIIKITSENHLEDVKIRFKGTALSNRLKKYNGFNVGYTHIADNGTITNEVRSLEIDYQGFSYLTTNFSTVIINGMTGTTTIILNGLSGNQSISVPDGSSYDLNITNNQEGTWTAKSDIGGNTSQFNYRVPITLNHSGALSDYQIKLNVSMNDSVRFNYANGAYIPYWNATDDGVWIKNDYVDGNTTIYMYYGNLGLSSASSGDDTFMFFDTCDDLSKWTTSGSSISIVDGEIYIGDTTALMYTGTFESTDMIIEFDSHTPYTADTVVHMGLSNTNSIGSDETAAFLWWDSLANTNKVYWRTWHNGALDNPSVFSQDTSPHSYKLESILSTSTKFYKDGSLVHTSTTQKPDELNRVVMNSLKNGYAYADNITVRKYTAIEPTYSIGAIQQAQGETNITASITGDNNTQSYNTSQSREFTLTPTATNEYVNITTTSTDYDITITTYWTDDTTESSQTASAGYVKSYINYTPSYSLTTAIFNTTISLGTHNFSADDYVGTATATGNGSSLTTNRNGQELNSTAYNLSAGIEYLVNISIPYNNAQTVNTIANMSINISESTQFTAPTFSDPEGLGINSEIWYFGDGNDSTNHNPTHTYTSTGVYLANYTVTENATVSPQTITRDFTVFVYDRNITCVLESRTPGNLTLNSRGTISLVYNCSCGDGINADNIFITGSVEGNLTSGLPNRWSARPPPNNKTVSSGYVNDSILRAHGRNKGFWFEGLGIFNDTFSYAVFDKNSPYVTITNYSDHAIINMTWGVPPAAFRNQIYIEQTNQTDDGDYEVYDSNGLLTTIWDISAYRDDQNYTILDEYSISYNGNPDASLVMYYCNDTHSIIADPLPNGIDMTDNTLLYHLDETAGAIVDSSGTNNNGTYTGTEYNQIGKVDTSIGFDGNDEIGFATDTSLYGENVTVSAWIYWNAESGTVDPIVSQTNPAGWGYRLYIDTVTDRAVFWLDNTGVSSSNIIPKNKWVHIVGTHNESELRIYVNTVDEVLAKTGSGKNFVGYVGYDGVGEYFNGRIDEVAIWGRTLNDSEVDHIFHMGAPSPDIDDHNAAYIGAFDTSDIVNGKIQATIPVVNGTISNVMVTNTSYRYIISDCSYSSGQWIVDYSNNKTFINVSFADSNVSLSTIDDGGNFAYTEFTPIVSSYSVVPLDTYYSGIYVENTFGDSYANLSFVSDLIDDVNLNISNPSITTVGSDFGGEDNPNDGTIITHAGSSYIRVNMAVDPDAQASVNHTLYLLYQNETIYQTINNSLYSSAAFVDIDLTTCIYASDTYRLRVDAVADDNPSDTQTFTTGNFTILGNTPATAYNGNLLGFVGATDIPTLHSLINNDSYMSYDIGSNTYTMHVTHYQVCYNDVFNFSSKVYLRSENSSDKTINYNWNGYTDFTSAEITAWDITENAAAPSTDLYRSALISCDTASGNITNSSFYNLGSDVIDRDGLILIDFDNINIINNTFVYCHHPIVIKDDSDNNIIENNRLLNSYDNGMLISTYSDYNYVANNTIDISGSRGIYLYYSSHNILYNNSVQNCDSYDYYFRVQCVNNTLIDPYDAVNEIRPTSSSDGSIINTDNQAFSHTSQYFQTTAHISNFSMGYGGVSETFNITQRDMYITPINDSIVIENLNWTTAVSLNATSNTSINPVWFNITHEMWNYETVEVFRNGSLYDTTPATDDVVAYNYVGGFSEWYFRFTPHEYFISGYVTDFSNTSITDVFVSDNRSIDSATTNASGYYSLYGYINGSHTLIATKEGYYPGTLEVGVSGADLLNQNIILTQILEVLENMTWHIFILLAVICVMLIWYSFTRTDISYYTDVITSILAVVLSALLAYDSIIGIGYYFATDTSVQSLVYQSVPLAIIFGSVTLMMVIFTIVKILELVHQEVEEI